VLGMTCPDAPAALQLCGTPGDGGWTADVPASASPIVLAQLDLA
jgi:hypothetical protein